MSNVYAKSVQGCVIEQEEAFDRADRNARRAHKADRQTTARSGRLGTLILALFVSGLSAAVGFIVGPGVAQSDVGMELARVMNPFVTMAMSVGVIEYLVGGIFLAIVGLVWFIRS